jgi:hypothetical protein
MQHLGVRGQGEQASRDLSDNGGIKGMRIGRPFFGAALPHSAWKIGWGYPLFLVCFRPKAEHRDLIFDEKSGTKTGKRVCPP